MKFGFPFLRGWCGELSVCITPCLGEHGSVQQALGIWSRPFSHQESFKDLIYECTQKFCTQINPKHLLLALSVLKEMQLSPAGCSGTLLMAYVETCVCRGEAVLASHRAGCPWAPFCRVLPKGGWPPR